MEHIITVEEAAKFLNKHPDTIRRWIIVGKLKARHLPAGKNGIYVMLRSDLLEVVVTENTSEKKKIRVPNKSKSPPQPSFPFLKQTEKIS